MRECVDLLLHQCLHGRNVDDLERVPVNVAGFGVTELRDRSKDSKGSTVGLSSAQALVRIYSRHTFPAPVGAQMSIGSFEPNAIG